VTESNSERAEELPVVSALKALSVFSADQAGAYREHFAPLAQVLGKDVETKLGSYVIAWAEESSPGVLILTGNAGTGKTAVAEAYCRVLGASLPDEDGLTEIVAARWVIKDLSGFPDSSARATALATVLDRSGEAQALVCANEGVLRDALDAIDNPAVVSALELALRRGADRQDNVTIVNVNRQRPTGEHVWTQLLDFVSREELWFGCTDCPFDLGGCPMRSNAKQLRDPMVREQLRTLLRLGTGEAVQTLREVLAILSWGIVGDLSCQKVKAQNRALGSDAFTASSGYFTRVVGGGLSSEAVERSPLMTAMRDSGLGGVSDLEVDGWLRDTGGAPFKIWTLAGDPTALPSPPEPEATGAPRIDALAGSQSPLDRVSTKQRVMTFHALGEMVSTDEDPIRVEDGLDALVRGDGLSNAPALTLWRQRLFFEAPDQLGGAEAAARRLIEYRHLPDLFELAHKAAGGADIIIELNQLVQGLNFLVTGFSSADEGLIVPDPAFLFSRDPGSFRPAKPTLVHSLIDRDRLSVTTPDQGLVEDILDVDHIDVDLVVDRSPRLSLRIRPRMYEAIREAEEFQGPVGQGVAEMNDLRGFYGRLARSAEPEGALRVANPDSQPPALARIILPHLTGIRDS
jgi:hypothetical protein